jgi:hypothetical protein
MTELILGVAIVAIAMVGLAAGSLLGGRCLRRGCASTIGPDGRPQTCSTCGKGGSPSDSKGS